MDFSLSAKMPYFCGGEKELKNFSPQRTNFQKVFLYLHLNRCMASSTGVISMGNQKILTVSESGKSAVKGLDDLKAFLS